jgi:hypothetical protein
MFETIILVIFIMFIIIYKLVYKSDIITIEAFDKNPYLVNNLQDAQDAANVLAKIMITMNKLVNIIVSNFKVDSFVLLTRAPCYNTYD